MKLHQPIFGGFCIALAALASLMQHFFGADLAVHPSALPFGAAVFLLLGLFFAVDWAWIGKNYFFDNAEWSTNKDRNELVKRLRLRALLLHNFSVGVLVVTVLVIFGSLYLFAAQPANPTTDAYASLINWSVGLVLLIFLVQVLFRVFKYLLRVGSFYHGIADALELHRILGKETPATAADLDKLLERLAPSAYDMSDVEATGLLGAIKDLVKK